jgi:hypothetical protein
VKVKVMALMVVVALAPLVADAQRNPGRGRRGGNLALDPTQDSIRRNRQQMVGQLGNRMEERMKTLLNLSDAQLGKVREVNARHSQKMALLNQQEREIRMSLREEAITADSSRQAQVAELLDRLTKAMRQRVDLIEQEQRDLATVLTPLQRATYLGMQEQMRLQVERVRMQQQGRLGGLPDGQQGPPLDGLRGGRRGLRPPPNGGVVPPA